MAGVETVLNGLFQKQSAPPPPVEDSRFQKLYPPPWNSIKTFTIPWHFPVFSLPSPAIFKIQTPLEFRCPQQAGTDFFLEKLNTKVERIMLIFKNLKFLHYSLSSEFLNNRQYSIFFLYTNLGFSTIFKKAPETQFILPISGIWRNLIGYFRRLGTKVH